MGDSYLSLNYCISLGSSGFDILYIGGGATHVGCPRPSPGTVLRNVKWCKNILVHLFETFLSLPGLQYVIKPFSMDYLLCLVLLQHLVSLGFKTYGALPEFGSRDQGHACCSYHTDV